MYIYKLEATGTIWEIGLEGVLQETVADTLAEQMHQIIKIFDARYSRFNDSSLISNWSNTTGEFELDEESKELFDTYFDFCKNTKELFTPLIGQALTEAGYDKNYSLKPGEISNVQKLHTALELQDRKLIVKEKVQLDFGGVGKGYLIDKLKNYLQTNNIKEFIINGGGDFYYYNTENKKLKIGLEHPLLNGEVIGSIEIVNQSLCGSSGNRRQWGEHHHIINPEQKKSSDKILASWVIADTATIADSLSTCLFLVDPDELQRHYEFEYLILENDMTIKKSDNFNADIFYKTHGYA